MPETTPHSVGSRRGDDVLRHLEIDVTRRLDGILHGEHRGLVPGHGSEPGEARPYQAGDDVRRIDWSVTARLNSTHIRDSIADRELETWLVVDRSASLDFGTSDCEKRDLVLAAAAGTGILTNRGGNRVGALIVDSQRCTTVPARQGRKHLLGILHRIESAERTDGPPLLDLAAALRRAAAITKRRGLVVVISDWLDDPESWRHPLAALALRHQVLCVETVDPRELELPGVGVLTLIDTETGRTREIDTGDRRLRERYALAAAEQRQTIERTIIAAGADHLQLRTDRDWVLDLARFVTLRKRRHANVSRGTR